MPTRILRDPDHVCQLADQLGREELPLTVSWSNGATRRNAQNRLAFQWFKDIASDRGDMTIEQVRAECKLHHGIPILRAENQAFRASYDRVLKHLPYEDKLEAIQVFDLPVTRLMTVKQMTAFLDAVQTYYISQGVLLTDPEALKYQEEFT